MEDARPILILDSGIGGLSVLAEIARLLPRAPVVYAADSAFYPYGTKSAAEIEARVPALLARLADRYSPRLAVIACNTASTIGLASVRATLNLPVVGTVPAIKPAAEQSRSRVIGVLGTPATVIQPYVDRLAAEFAADCRIVRHGSAELVDLAESKLRGEPIDAAAVAAAVAPMRSDEEIDTIVLACTHFPLLRDELAAAIGRPVRLVDGNSGIARRTAWLTREEDWPAQRPEGVALFTGISPDPMAYRAALAAYGLTRIEMLEPDR